MDALSPRSQFSLWALGLEAETSLRLFSFPLACFRAMICQVLSSILLQSTLPASHKGPVTRISVN